MFKKSINCNIILSRQPQKAKSHIIQRQILTYFLFITAAHASVFPDFQNILKKALLIVDTPLLNDLLQGLFCMYVPGTKMHSCQSELNLKVHSKEFYHESSFCYFEQFMEGNSWQGGGKAFIRSTEFDKNLTQHGALLILFAQWPTNQNRTAPRKY